MALDLGDLDAFLDASMTFRLEKGGKQYSIPPVPAVLGLWGRRVAALRADVPEGATEKQIAAALARAEKELGPPPIPAGQSFAEGLLSKALVAELMADGASDAAIEHLAQVAYARIIGGDEVALFVFRGDDPKAIPANRQERRAANKATPRKASASKTTSTAADATTRKPASGSGTKSQKAAKPAAKAASRGARS